MSQLLYRFIESEHYDALLAVVYLARYADHIGIHHYLCTKLRQFKQEEIEFFLPQLCHLCISTNSTDSVALEEFILELCERSAHGALLTFWLFQTHLHDLSHNPHQSAFKVCQRIFNKVQRIVFGGVDAKKKDPLHENIFPVTLLSSFTLGAVAAPFLPHYAGPLAISQARRPQIIEEPSDPKQPQALPPKITRSKTVGTEDRPRRRRERPQPQHVQSAGVLQTTHNISTGRTPKSARPPSSPLYERSEKSPVATKGTHRERTGGLDIPAFTTSSTSLPDLRDPGELSNPPSPAIPPPKRKSKRRAYRPPVVEPEKPKHPSEYTREDKIQLLRSNYFRNETLFLAALEEISNRLVAVPKPARLSALRAELALMNHDLPVEVDIPVLCPATMHEDHSRTTHHRVVRINPAEATVLNSAERVPYLLMVEVLRDDFDFNPETPDNQTLLSNFEDPEFNKRRLFDLSETTRKSYRYKPAETATDSVFEPAEGDIGTSPLLEQFPTGITGPNGNYFNSPHPPRLSSGVATMTSSPLATPRTSETPGRDSEGSGTRKSFLTTGREGPDITALAHMRAAANMLAQLNTSGSKRPKDEVEAIKSKIIASMQVLEEKNFYFTETVPVPTFDTIIANSSTVSSAEPGTTEIEPTPVNVEAGIARMENDMKTSGVARKADREDPSAATFGEEWSEKKERIRKSSPYGLCRNWDLLSVIVKTGGDLRQETFACQLIELCGKIWAKAGVDVWVKRMRILVTGESSGLIETITNGTSIHSLKRCLVLEAAKNKLPNGKIPVVTLKDHFIKTFGAEDTPTYEAAVDAFMRSLAAYSIISYILQLKDRHNGNILIDNKGHIIHIDFGFMFSNSPGSIGFETAPFKLTTEYVDVLGGLASPTFERFRTLCKQAYQALRKSADNIVLLVELMSKDSKMPCFTSGSQYITSQLRYRFQLQMSELEAEHFVDEMLINRSYNSYFTRAYDAFQYHSQGIY